MKTNFAYFGTPYVASETLEALVSAGYVPSVVITSPDAPSGRGNVMTACPTKVWAESQGIPVLTPARLDPIAIDAIRAYNADFALVVAYGKIIPQPLLGVFPMGILNIHYSLLPKYRGASPVESAILHGETKTGVSIQKMVYELDAGDVLATAEVEISPTETTKELRPRLIQIGAELLLQTLPPFIDGSVSATPQNHALATHFGKIKKEEGFLSLNGNDETNWNKYRAYAESPGTYFFAVKDDKRIRVKIVHATYVDGRFLPTRIIPEGKTEQDFSYLSQTGFAPE